MNNESGVGWVKRQCATSSLRPVFLLFYYFRVPRHMLLTVQHKYVWFHLRLFLCLLSLLFLQNTSLSLLSTASHAFYIKGQNAKCHNTCLMKASIIWSAVLCNDFQPWEKPQQHTCKITKIVLNVLVIANQLLTSHSPFAPLCKVDDWLARHLPFSVQGRLLNFQACGAKYWFDK